MSVTQTLATAQSLTATEQYNGFSSGLSKVTGSEVVFPKGLNAFEDYKCFTYKKEPRLKPFIYMHSTVDPEISFVCVDPYILTPSYQVDLKPHTLMNLQLEKIEDAIVLCLVSVGKDMYTTTANLMSPIVINPVSGLGEQVVMEDLGIEFLRYNVWDSIGKDTSPTLNANYILEEK